MSPKTQSAGRRTDPPWAGVFAGLFGAFLGLCLLKFSNTPVTEKYVEVPQGFWEFLLGYPWPIAWAYWLLAPVVLVGLFVARWKSPAPWWLVGLPLLWLSWQLLAGAQSIGPDLTSLTMRQFSAGVVCFYLGYFSLSRVRQAWPFWLCLLCCFSLVLAFGWEQHFGGLKASREYFFQKVYPYLKDVPPDYLKKISSDRIFSTLFYPNALAGAMLLLLPVALAAVWQLRALLTPAARGFLVAVVGVGGLGCLFWSGSKGGWLLMLLLGLVALLQVPFNRRLKIALVMGILLVGLAGFFVKYAGFFRKGATSVVARFDYWRAAAQTARDNPIVGTGPGTFKLTYEKIKRPESEMARLAHNDYLQQASDSGIPGCLAYTLFIVGALVWTFPNRARTAARGSADWLVFSLWLGVLGWSLQGLIEFGLYIPALAWPAFTFLGWLLGKQGPEPPLKP